jgi:hypothetical protein
MLAPREHGRRVITDDMLTKRVSMAPAACLAWGRCVARGAPISLVV